MSFSLYDMIRVGPVALAIALLLLPAYYIYYLRAPAPKLELRLGAYLLGAVCAGVAGYALGAILGITSACFSDDAGNLCGLVGVFGFGPLLSAIGIVGVAHRRVGAARHSSPRNTSGPSSARK